MNSVTEQVDVEPLAGPPPAEAARATAENAAPAPAPASDSEPASERVIAGYRLLEHIGEGGFGAVWRAEAPGGMLKAVKLVHGRFDERRAVEELKSLEKIKDARHPFLLSLERIEVIDGQLIVVTELADESLKQRYERSVKAGAPGIARDDLLRMMAEAADALDYMSKRHGLAHLDIKPENILLVGDHVKVADFGLVKSVHSATQSLVGGLTPLFAAPETFDGRPSDRSDQYSLAVVYQFALTGKLPFTGKTTAQLAAQHTTARPELSSLPDCDRAIIERALEKDPFDRFETCRAFVERLLAIKSAIVIPNSKAAPEAEPFHTELIDEEAQASESATTTGPIRGATAAQVIDLPALELPAHDPQRPTLVIGLGGCGAKAVSALTQRLTEHYGPCDALSWFDALVIDTDYDEFINSFVGENEATLSERQFIHLPLKPTHYYRKNAGDLTRWLSRRWIYNIPKSQKPDGVRPLGRLALIDNLRPVEKQVDQAVAELCRGRAQADTAEPVDVPLPIDRTHPRVFLVGSLTGGTGGAIFSDVAQLVHRAFFEHENIEPEIVCVLAHWTSSTAEAAELSAVNACAALTELHHLQTDGCPGDVTCHLPALGRHHGLFKHVYYVDLGWHAQTTSFSAAADELAGYLEINMSADLANFGSRARQATSEQSRGVSVARTFSFATLDADDLHEGSSTVNQLVGELLRRVWLSGEDLTRLIREAIVQVGHEVEIQPDKIKQRIRTLNRPRVEELFNRAAEAKPRRRTNETELASLLEQQFPRQPVLHKPSAAAEDPMQIAVAELLKVLATELHRSITKAIENSPTPVVFAEQLLPQLINHLEVAKRRTDDAEDHVGEDDIETFDDPLDALAARLQRAEADNSQGWLVQVLQMLQASLRGLLRRIQEMKQAIRQKSSFLTAQPHPEQAHEETLLADLAGKWDAWVNERFGGMGSLLLRHQIDAGEAVTFLLHAVQEQLLARRLAELTDALHPAALQHGGARRVLIAAPMSILESETLKKVTGQLAQPPTFLAHEGSGVLLWCEGEQVKIRDLITSLAGHRPELLELSAQLHVRNDVAWAKP